MDSKFNAVLSALKIADKGESHIWIYTSYQSTISYLYSSLSEYYPKAFRIHGGLPPGEVAASFDRFQDGGGILIASTMLLTGVQLPVDTLILYDIPESEVLLYQLFSRRFVRPQAETNRPMQIVALNDVSNVLSSEAKRLRKLQSIVEQLTEE